MTGCLTAIRIKHKQLEFIVASVYVPTGGSSGSKNQKERVEVYRILRKILDTHDQIPVVLIGDMNGRVDIERDHFTSSQTPYKLQDGDKRLQTLLQNYNLHDSYRRKNPDTTAYTHESITRAGPTRSRIDYALLNDHAMRTCTQSFISENPLDINLHHKTIGITILYSARWKFAKEQKNEAKAPKIIWQKIDAEKTANFKKKVDQDERILSLRNELKEENTSLMSRKELKKLVTKFYVLLAIVIRHAAKTTLPIKNPNQSPISYRTKSIKLKEARIRLNKASALTKSEDPIETLQGEHMIENLFEKYRSADTITVTNKIKYIDTRIKRQSQKFEREEIAKKILKRETQFAFDQKKQITKILERNIDWDNLTSIQDPNSKETIIEPREIKKVLRRFFKNKSTGPTLITPKISTTDILPPPLDIDPGVWNGMMKKATVSELKNAIKVLPKNKACGPDGISNEILQLLNAADSEVVIMLLDVMNIAIEKQIYSTTVTNGVMTMLPKKENWGGDLTKLRPITLLNTMHKLFEKLLNDRLCNILNGHHLLQGPNFGFQAGQGTAEPLFILSNVLDICKDNKTSFYTAALDVAAAFDKLPWKAIGDGLRRIKAPDNFVRLLQTMHENRTLTINTPFGKTTPFTPTIGVAQGGILSPTLWLIAYDPLLQALQERTQGITLPSAEEETLVKICCFAYADDLHPIATSEEDLQMQLNMIHSFLSFYNMEMNASKSHILTNIDADSCKFPTNSAFSISNSPIAVKKPHEITRILGVWMSMDNMHKETREHTIAKLATVTNLILAKSTPGSLGAFLAKTVIQPQILYRLQNTFCTTEDYDKINISLRKLTKKKMMLPMNTRNEVLQDKRIKLGVQDFKIAHEKALISNAMVFVTSRNRIGNFTRAMVNHFSRQVDTPLSLFEAPLKFSAAKQKGSTIKLISNMLFNHGIQLRIPDSLGAPASYLTPADYRTHYQDIKKYKISRMSDIYDIDRRRTKTFNKFCAEHESRNMMLSTPGPPPTWFIVLIRSMVKRRVNVTRTSSHRLDLESQFDTTPLPELNEAEIVRISTDGSYKEGRMGSAAVFEISGQNQPTIVMTQPTSNNPSANKAELAAIYMALLVSHPHNRITINYDCESAVKDINQFQKYSFTQRLKLKTKDYPLVQAIVILLDKFDHSVIFNKIRRDINIADGPSKIAREENLPPIQILKAHQSPHQYQMTIKNAPDTTYPRRLINDAHQSRMEESNDATLRLLWNNRLDSEIDCNRTLQVSTTGLDRKNHLDANLHQLQTHILNTTFRNLKSMDIRFTYTDNLFADNYCHMCDGAYVEDQEHSWKCDFALLKRHDILRNARELALKDLEKPDRMITASTINRVFSMMNLTPDNFLDNPLSKGIISKRDVRKSNTIANLIPEYSGNWIINISASLARSFWELVWRPRTAKIEGIRLELESAKRETIRQMALSVKRRTKRLKEEAQLAATEAKLAAKEELRTAKSAAKTAAREQKAQDEKRNKEERALARRELRNQIPRYRKRRRETEEITESDDEETPIYSTQELRDQRAAKRSKLTANSIKRKRESALTSSAGTKSRKTYHPEDNSPCLGRIQQSTDPPGSTAAPN